MALGLNLAALALPTVPVTQMLLLRAAAQTAADQLAEANRLLGQGAQQLGTSKYREAIQSWQQALEICRNSSIRQAYPQESRNGEAVALLNLGEAYRRLSQYQQAIDYYQQALPIFRDVGDRDTEGLLLANIGRLYVNQNSPVSAIQQLQKSVEVRESIRAGLRGLPQADQQAYTDSIAKDYRLLAELLKQQNRSSEAQAVLNLL